MVFLLGFMGCGKTYWAKRLSGILGLPCYDLDELIEQQHEMTVRQIFEKSGESAFRDIEKQVLHQCTHLAPGIIAAGGGTPCFFDNMDWMNANGLTIYLKTPVDLLTARLKKERLLRPLLAKVEAHALSEHIEHLVAQREHYYNKAAICLEQNADNIPAFEKMLLEAISAEPG
jgi:shikimate kinase